MSLSVSATPTGELTSNRIAGAVAIISAMVLFFINAIVAIVTVFLIKPKRKEKYDRKCLESNMAVFVSPGMYAGLIVFAVPILMLLWGITFANLSSSWSHLIVLGFIPVAAYGIWAASTIDNACKDEENAMTDRNVYLAVSVYAIVIFLLMISYIVYYHYNPQTFFLLLDNDENGRLSKHK